jgi:ParB family transcriptional regulator, chromosome partitioning protein
MVTSKRMGDIMSGLDLDAVSKTTASSEKQAASTPVGKMMAASVEINQQKEQINELKAKLDAAGRGEISRKIDPNLIQAGKYANRIEASFNTDKFKSLRQEIAQSEGNIQPIKVRPTENGKFEVVFGHRRHRACLEEGFDVLCIVENLSDEEAFIQMDRENREREDLRPIEVGYFYKKALDAGLFPSLRSMALKTGIDHGNLSRAITLANLPKHVLNAFTNPLDLQYADAALLNSEVQKNPDAILNRAKFILTTSPRPNHRQTLALLLGFDEVDGLKDEKFSLQGSDSQKATIRLNYSKKKAQIEITGITDELIERLQSLIQEMIGAQST